MTIEHLIGRHFRLQQELAIAYSEVPWNTGHINRLTDEMARTEREIAAGAASDMRTDAPLNPIALRRLKGSPIDIASPPRFEVR